MRTLSILTTTFILLLFADSVDSSDVGGSRRGIYFSSFGGKKLLKLLRMKQSIRK